MNVPPTVKRNLSTTPKIRKQFNSSRCSIPHSDEQLKMLNEVATEATELTVFGENEGSPTVFGAPTDRHEHFIRQQIQYKINGYKQQDLRKNKWNADKFIDPCYILQKLKACDLICYYCEKPVTVLYENVRDPQQWSLERIDNAQGHNTDNVEIACLKCNLERRLQNSPRFKTGKKYIKFPVVKFS
jgi:hypothetical protein